VANVVVQITYSDKWEWLPDPDTCYSVREAHNLLTHLYPRETSLNSYLIWNKLVPSKISTFAWQFINDRLSTKLNFFIRGYCLCNDSLLCSNGCNAIEGPSSFSELSRRWRGLAWNHFLVGDHVGYS
jgi:hypothetical protein